MALCKRQLQRALAAPSKQGESSDAPIVSTTQENRTFSKSNLLILLSRGSLIPTNNPGPTLELLAAGSLKSFS